MPHRDFAMPIVAAAVEAFHGWKSNLPALLADVGHNVSDVASVGLA